jgi:hypothetical protein
LTRWEEKLNLNKFQGWNLILPKLEELIKFKDLIKLGLIDLINDLIEAKMKSKINLGSKLEELIKFNDLIKLQWFLRI